MKRILFLVSVLFLASASLQAAVTVGNLRCEYAQNPLGIDVIEPRLSWVIESSDRGTMQSAYQVLVASSAEKLATGTGDLSDSGKVASDQSIQVAYAGKPLASRQRAHWLVRVWDNKGAQAASEPAWWEMGLLKPAQEWQAKWIGYTTADAAQASPLEGARWIWFADINPIQNAPKGDRFFRRTVEIPAGQTIKSATLAVTVDDQFTAYIDGAEIGQSSGQTDAWKEVKTFDLKPRLKPGKNVLSIKAFNDAHSAGAIAKLDIVFDSGTTQSVVTDKSWQAASTAAADTAWSAAKELAKFGEGPWKALAPPKPLGQVPHLRKAVTLAKPVKQARLYASAFGVYEFSINGQRVSGDIFNPSWTDYKKRVQYHTYDVAPLLRYRRQRAGHHPR